MTMRISDEMKETLNDIKEKHGFSSLEEAIEFRLDSKKIVYERMMDWLAEIIPKSSLINYVKIEENEERYKFILYMHKYSYPIYITKDGRYMSAYLSSRTRTPGEDWTRGSDLPDGTFNRKTWEHIKNRIIWTQLISLSPEILSRLELRGHDTGSKEAKRIADIRREQNEDSSKDAALVEGSPCHVCAKIYCYKSYPLEDTETTEVCEDYISKS